MQECTSHCSAHIRWENLVTLATTNSVVAAVTRLVRHCGLYEYGNVIAGKRDGYGRAHMVSLRQEESMPVGAKHKLNERRKRLYYAIAIILLHYWRSRIHTPKREITARYSIQQTRWAYGGTSKLDCPSVVASPTNTRKAGRRTFMLRLRN